MRCTGHCCPQVESVSLAGTDCDYDQGREWRCREKLRKRGEAGQSGRVKTKGFTVLSSIVEHILVGLYLILPKFANFMIFKGNISKKQNSFHPLVRW